MSVLVSAPGRADLRLEHLLLDVNGTLTDRGLLLDGVAPRLRILRARLDVHLLSADTFGTLDEVAQELDGVPVERISDGQQKAALARDLGAASCAAIGNGANDRHMLETVGLGIAVIGPEGASPPTLAVADIVTGSVLEALDLLDEPRALAATLRS
jgi:soluble P-type ATPase